MFGQQPEEMYHRRAEREAPASNLHHRDEVGDFSHPSGEYSPPEPISTAATTTAVPSPENASEVNLDGTWGERDVGGPVNQKMAMEDYEQMRRELTRLSAIHSRSSQRRPSLLRSVTGKTTKSKKTRRSASRASTGAETEDEGDLEEGQSDDSVLEEFKLGDFIRDGHFEKRTEDGDSTKKVGVVFKQLTVKVVGSKATFVKTLPDAILGTFGPDLWHLLTRFIPALKFGKQGATRDLIHDFSGVVRDGEMMLVLGRPGSGCSTFLKAIANKRSDYAAITGDVSYGGIPAEEQDKYYRGEVSYNPEDDVHLPMLSVWRTLQFSLMNKTRKHAAGGIKAVIEALMAMFAISHTKDTPVGNEYLRGVSGGERKRVSIAETLATKSTVTCWDNSTRGLDASTALDYANSLRIMTDVSSRTTLVTLYQAGEGIFDLMDKVLVIEDGRMIYQGPAQEAKQYFIDLGFECPERQTTADFLTSLTDAAERKFLPGREASTPKTPEELERVFKQSENYKRVLEDIKNYEQHVAQSEHRDARTFQQSVKEQKSKTVSKRSSYTVSFFSQVRACTIREFWLLLGDRTTLYTKAFIIISNALIVGSLFYGQTNDTSSAFSRGGTVFFSIVFLGWLQLTELMKAVSGRVVIARHKEYAFYRPSAVSIARVVVDLPVVMVQSMVFGLVMYFMTGLDTDVSKFFIYLLFIYVTTICITALYRMMASLSPSIDDAVRFSGISLNILVVLTGYVIPKSQLISQKIWFGWLYYVNPLSYSYEAVITNEFAGRVMPCAQIQLVPQGPGVQPQYQGCALSGAEPGATTVTGEAYLSTTYGYTRDHLWRNFGVVIAFTVLYILVTAIASELFSFTAGGGGALAFKKSKKARKHVALIAPPVADEEKGGQAGDSGSSSDQLQTLETHHEALKDLAKSESIFTWENVEYSVPQRRLLNNINGYVKPGLMIALMGASGAGKTTLLNTLAGRQKTGIVGGQMLVDGRTLGTEFQRGTGFVEQMDLHDMTATVKEALAFSAVLRQDRNIPKAEKLAYVDKILNLLELEEIQDAILMSLGVEQRKRVTIGVELAAKPSLLLFLDEPTSGLDSQSAFSIVRFLKKLAAAGQAIICTIHQPSSELIQQFDQILALNPGGNTFYYGPVGDNGSAVIKYFADRGVHCPPSKNVAEFILETAAKGGKRADGKRLNWNREWRESQENAEVLAEIARLKEVRSKVPPPNISSQHEFASPILLQTTTLTTRMFTQYWRDPSYLYGKLFVSVIVGIFNGFTFWKLDFTVAGMQDRLFTSFLIIMIPPTIINSVVPKFYQNRSLWEARELPSRIYGWFAFCTASLVTEVPIAIVGAVIYYVLWYFPTGQSTEPTVAGYVFLMTMLFFIFQASWGQWICAFAPSFTVISNVLPFFFVMFSLFNGVVRPWSALSPVWRYWIYYMNPSTYWISGTLAATLPSAPVRCAPSEAAYFSPPPNMTCQDYAGAFVQAAGQGYLTNPSGTADCGYCPFKDGTEYMATLNIVPDDKWKYFGIFLAFCVSNWALVYFFIYTTRVRGWSFGLGTLFGWLEKGVEAVKVSVKRSVKREPNEKA